jgi:hypothetical protein
MKSDEKSPEGFCRSKRGQNISLSVCEQGKDIKQLSERQKKVFNLLLSGKHSVTDITVKTGYSDPRSYIRDLREKGITIYDQWVKKGDARYKIYWVPLKTNLRDIHTVGEVLQTHFKNLFERNHD